MCVDGVENVAGVCVEGVEGVGVEIQGVAGAGFDRVEGVTARCRRCTLLRC